MGSRSKRHGLTGIKSRQPTKNVADRTRNDRLVAKKAPLIAEVRAALKDTPEVA